MKLKSLLQETKVWERKFGESLPTLKDTTRAFKLKKEQDEKDKPEHFGGGENIDIFGYDKSPSAIIKARENIESANLNSNIKVFQKDFFNSKKQGSDYLHIVTNPPYGERLKGDINSLYSKIGDSLKLSFSNTNFWFISSNFEAMKHFGLRPSRKIKLFNGKLESRLLFFPIYEGTKKIHKK